MNDPGPLVNSYDIPRVAALEEDQRQLREANALLKHELGIAKARADHWYEMCKWVYQRSRDAMFTMPGGRENREKRDAILSEINYKVGGAIR